jgi:hypothetical protein
MSETFIFLWIFVKNLIGVCLLWTMLFRVIVLVHGKGRRPSESRRHSTGPDRRLAQLSWRRVGGGGGSISLSVSAAEI